MWKEWLEQQKSRQFTKRLLLMLLGVTVMGFTLSFLILIHFGTDPAGAFNLGCSRFTKLSFGTCQFLFNLVMFVFVIFFNRKLIGFGTIGNMVLVGYVADFFGWIWEQVLPSAEALTMGARIGIFIPSIVIFVIAAAVYMTCDLGMAPYDAIPFILSDLFSAKTKIPFLAFRMAWDAVFTILAYLIGGEVGIVTVMMIFLIGPIVSRIKTFMEKKIFGE